MSKKSINIVLVALNYSPEPTGIGPFAADLASGLRDRGHCVGVTTGYPHYPQWKQQGDCSAHDSASAREGIEISRKRHPIPSQSSLLSRSLMEASFGVRAAFGGHTKADLVLCVSPPLLATAAIVMREKLRIRRIPVVVWVQDLYGVGVAETKGSESWASRATLAFESRTFRAATALAVIHDRFKRHIVDQLNVEGANVTVFRNWSRQEPITLVDRDEALRTLGWESLSDHTIVLHAGNIGTKQGLDNVVHAAKLADRSPKKVLFMLLGDGHQRPRLEKMAEGIRSIRFIDVLDDVLFGHALRAANILLVNQQPAISDMSLPSKLVSYYMAGRPVIAAVDAESGAAEEVRNSGAGVVVPADDPQRLLDEVFAVGSDVEGSQRMGMAGWEFIQQHFDRDSTIDALSDWLIEIADPSNRGRAD